MPCSLLACAASFRLLYFATLYRLVMSWALLLFL